MSSNKISLFDSHIHLDDPNFALDLNEQFNLARDNHIHGWIVPATISAGFESIYYLTQHHANCYAAYGLHPYFIQSHTEEDLQLLKQTLQNKPCIAVGECGLDLMIPEPDLDKQLHFFKQQIKLALEFDLPVIIHTRKTVDLVLKEIRKHPTLKGVFHSFSGSLQQAEIALKHNFLLGFGGASTFPRAQKLHSIIKEISLQDFIIETDAPFQRGFYRDHGLNYPKDLLKIAKNIAVLREDSLESIANTTTENVKRLFQLKD